jgi:7-carboxy-7-deazaguanine synthase (Cx14CxxC type)
MSYAVKEIYYTLQGEGGQTGRAAVFCRFAGCNLWSGLEGDRADATCPFCDTDFVGLDGPGGGRYEAAKELAGAVRQLWPRDTSALARRLVVCTGGEPLLQLDQAAIEAFHAAGFDIAVETNGTLPVPPGIDWVCVSPKAGTDLVVREGDELKLVFPQEGLDPTRFTALSFRHFYLQPMDGPAREANTRLAAEYCLHHPEWRLSLQTHKLLGLP